MADDLEFERAEPVEGGSTAAMACGTCERAIGSAYYEASGQILCAPCKGELAETLRDRGNYLKGLVFGLGGALLGALIYFAVAALTGYEVGLIAILVGWLVGKGMATGSGGVGGRRYQLTAFFLTYLAISISYGGLVVKEIATTPGIQDSLAARSARLDSLAARTGLDADTIAARIAALEDQAAEAAATSHGSDNRWLALGGFVLGLLLLPLLIGFGNLPGSLISLLIIGYGLWQAWHMNARPQVTITGPFAVGGRPGAQPEPVSDALL